ncbi:hypothetical protein SKA58_10205 [Sphingomonas sp. SKA58]|nr:hypothetical protein SKA58_10205 [Sphingomonas sp. SKA58]
MHAQTRHQRDDLLYLLWGGPKCQGLADAKSAGSFVQGREGTGKAQFDKRPIDRGQGLTITYVRSRYQRAELLNPNSRRQRHDFFSGFSTLVLTAQYACVNSSVDDGGAY